jgi:hypothetical protein
MTHLDTGKLDRGVTARHESASADDAGDVSGNPVELMVSSWRAGADLSIWFGLRHGGHFTLIRRECGHGPERRKSRCAAVVPAPHRPPSINQALLQCTEITASP